MPYLLTPHCLKRGLLSGVWLGCCLSNPVALAQPLPADAKTIGNIMGDSSRSVFDLWNPDGFSFLRENPRSPSGLLYGHPLLRHQERDGSGDSWETAWSLEFGLLTSSGDTRAAAFREYNDWNRGPALTEVRYLARKPATGKYFAVAGGSLGRDDQYVRAGFGRWGRYHILGYFQSLRHIFATNANVLWRGAGTDYLRLPASLTPGASSIEDVAAALASTENSRLSLTREKGGLSANINMTKKLKLAVSVSHEWREGSRAFGTAFSYPTFGQVQETVEPIDYQTTEIRAGLDYTSKKLQARFHYIGSLFNNANAALTVENPGLSAFPVNYIPPQGRQALAPDNQYHRFTADAAMPLARWNGRLTTSASYSTARQNQQLLTPTLGEALVNAAGQTIDLSLWSSRAALSQNSADAQVERLSLRTNLQLAPARKWRVSVRLRYDDESNSTDYTAFNPLTSQYGYIALDGGLDGSFPLVSGLYNPARAGSRVRFRNMPFEKDLRYASVQADYRLSLKSKLTFGAEYQQENRRPREVEETRDATLWAAFSSRTLDRATFRFSYRYTDRGGSDYIANPYEPFYTSSLPGYIPAFPDGDVPHTLLEFRKFDLVARHMHEVKAKVNFILADTLDLVMTGLLSRQDHRADFGVRGINKTRLNSELTWQPDKRTSIYAYGSYDHASRDVANVNDAGRLGTDGSIGGPLYPLENIWSAAADEKGLALGAGYKREFDRWDIDVAYSYVRNRSGLGFEFAGPGALASGISAAEAGTGLPDQLFTMHSLNAVLRWRVRNSVQLRFLYRLEHEDLNDYHYEGLITPLVGNDIFLGSAPENFTAHVFGVFVGFRY